MSWSWTPFLHVRHTARRVVRPEWTVPGMLPGSTLADRGEHVLATGALILLLEDATWAAITAHVPPHLALLGHAGTYQHTAPTLVGQTLHIEVTCTGGSGTRTSWFTIARNLDSGHPAGHLDHTLVTLDRDAFVRRLTTPSPAFGER